MSRRKKRGRDPSWLRRTKKEKPRPARIDERLELPGVGSITKAGRFVLWESRRSPTEQEQLIRRLAQAHPVVEAEIQSHVDALATTIPAYEPWEVLHRAYMDFFSGALGKKGEHEVEFSGLVDMRMLDYVHTLIVSLQPLPKKPLDDHGWSQLRHHMTELYQLLLMRWPSTQTAARRIAPDYMPDEQDEEEFRIPLLLDWLSVRGSRYAVHERERAEALLGPHDPLLVRLFGIDAKTIAKALEEILGRLTKGLGEAMQIILDVHTATYSEANIAASNLGAFDNEQALMALVEQTGRRTELIDAIDRALGGALFDITNLLPDSLLRAISLEPGEDTQFFAPGEHSGWPLRTPPTNRRPVLRCKERFYVFNPYSTDNFYRAIELAVVSADPSARNAWNQGQKRATEALPIDLLCALLPGATVYRDVEYPFQDFSGIKWCECDAVLLLDGLMLVVEVKAGRASDKSPFEATADHLRNVRNLLMTPALQAERFIRYTESQPEVALYDGSRNEIGRLRKREIDFPVRCVVTADSLAPVAGLFQHRPAATGGNAVPRSWCVSIDDLYVYRDVLRSPTFLRHFLTYRLKAFDMRQLAPLSELDHLGVYLETNAYVDWIDELGSIEHVALRGYRSKLDQYFGIRWECGEEGRPPTQRLPRVFREMIEKLEQSRSAGYLRAGGALLNLDGTSRELLASMVLEARRSLGPTTTPSRVVCISKKGGALPVYIGVRTEHTSPSEHRDTHLDHALSQMIASGARTGVLIEAQLTAEGTVTNADCTLLDLDLLSETKRSELRIRADNIAATRFDNARRDGVKIGRNEPCLCGSGRKFKSCCLRKA